MNWYNLSSPEYSLSHLLALLLFLIFSVLVLNLWRTEENSKTFINSDLCLYSFGFLSILAFRWMGLPHESPIQIDEVQAIVEARMFLAGALPWKNVDTTTCGALSSMLLTWPALFGLVPNYLTVQCTVLVAATSILILPNALKDFIQRKYVWTVCLLFWGFLCLIHHVYVFHFFNTYLPLAFLNLAIWFGLFSVRRTHGSIAIFFTGVLLGAIPYIKIQFAISAIVLFLIFLAVIWRTGKNQRTRKAALLVFGGIFVPCLATIFLFAIDAFSDFLNSYIFRAAQYGESNPYLSEDFLRLTKFVGFQRGIIENSTITIYHACFFVGSVLIALIALVANLPKHQNMKMEILQRKWLLLAASALLIAGIIAFEISKTGANYYLFLLFTPFIILTSTILSIAKTPRLTPWLASIAIAVMCGSWLFDEYGGSDVPLSQQLSEQSQNHLRLETQFLNQRLKASEPIAVWGYLPEIYLATNSLPATREAIGPMQILDNPQRSYFRRRFLTDLQRANPRYFVDGTGKGAFVFENRQNCGFENFPELKIEIEKNYKLVMDFTVDPDKPGLRVYENIKFDQTR